MHSHQIEGVRRAEFMLAGKAIFTLVSKETGHRITYRVARCKGKDDLYFVGVLAGPENTVHYAYLGTIRTEGGRPVYSLGRKSRITAEAPSAKAFGFLMGHIDDDRIEFWHEGRCGRCGRLLTVPESIANGIGPECAKMQEN